MRGSIRAFCAVAAFAAALTVVSAVSSCGIDHCSTCVSDVCTWCEAGYYASNGACKACSVNCRRCTSSGRCVSCNDGYELKYAETSNGVVEVSPYGKCVAKSGTPSCTDAKCTSCVAGVCLTCANGYYLDDGTCLSCNVLHCTHCTISGHCVDCDQGYQLRYAQSTVNETTIYDWGICVNNAVLPSACMALIAVVVSVLLVLAA